jgi:Tfp pilus assembly protein PilE
MKKGFWKGLRAIEIGIMLVLIIMLLSVVYARYDAFMCRSIESEAKFSLQQIYAAEMLYRTEHDRFASLETLLKTESRVVLPQKYYTFSDVPPEQDKFLVRAHGKEGTLVAGQAWQIDETKALVNIEPRCGK